MKSHANKEQRVEEARNLEREETRGSDERIGEDTSRINIRDHRGTLSLKTEDEWIS